MLQLKSKIAKTKMNEVWEGYVDGIHVAVKKPVTEDMIKLLRFVKEAKYWKEISDLRINGIVRVIEIDEDKPWFAVEYIEGKTLDQSLRNADIREIMERMLEVLWILHVVHKNGFFHLDLKPSNIIIDNYDDVEIIDWGIAARIFRKLADEKYTFIGTPTYAPPELWDPDKYGKPDQSSDIYEIGATFYRIIAKQVPFSKKSEVLSGQIRPFPKSVPRAVKKIILKAINPDRHKRYKDAMEMYRDIQKWLQRSNILWRGVYKIKFKSMLQISMNRGLNFVADPVVNTPQKKVPINFRYRSEAAKLRNRIAVINTEKITVFKDGFFVDYGIKRKLKAGATVPAYHGMRLYYKSENLGRLDFGFRNVIYADFIANSIQIAKRFFEFLNYLKEHKISYEFKMGREKLNLIAHKVLITGVVPEYMLEAVAKVDILRIHIRLVHDPLPDSDIQILYPDKTDIELYNEIMGCKP